MKEKNIDKNNLDNLEEKIKKLLIKISRPDLSKIIEENEGIKEMVQYHDQWNHYWGGADVIINTSIEENHRIWLKDQPLVISPQLTEPRKRLVVTKHAKELSWLFIQLGKIFRNEIDYISKYDFYALLAQTAINTIQRTNDDCELNELLTDVIKASKKFINRKEKYV